MTQPVDAPAAENGTAPTGDAKPHGRLAIDQIDRHRLELLRRTVAKDCTDAEIGHFLELCVRYDLDPFAHEAWCAKSKKNGRLLIMVGRDGLRKIAQRNGLHVDGDVVRESDEVTVCRTPDGNRTVTHSYGNPARRGAVMGAWAEVREGGPMGRPMGYFYASLEEYKPDSINDYSPWQKQLSVMILAAAERQAIRQPTPLSGLLAIGEDATIASNERQLGDGQGDGQPVGLDLGPEVEAILTRAAILGHEGLAERATAEVALADQPPEFVASWVAAANVQLDDLEQEQPADAEVVEDLPTVEDLRAQAQAAREQGDEVTAVQLELQARQAKPAPAAS